MIYGTTHFRLCSYEACIAFRIFGLGVYDLRLTLFTTNFGLCSHEGHIAFTTLGLGVCDLWLTLFKTHFGLCSHEGHIAFMIFGLGVCDLWLTIFKLTQEHDVVTACCLRVESEVTDVNIALSPTHCFSTFRFSVHILLWSLWCFSYHSL